jgi:hypothetical protein
MDSVDHSKMHGLPTAGRAIRGTRSIRRFARPALPRPADEASRPGKMLTKSAASRVSPSRTGGRVRSHALPVAPRSPLFRAQRQGLNCH